MWIIAYRKKLNGACHLSYYGFTIQIEIIVIDSSWQLYLIVPGTKLLRLCKVNCDCGTGKVYNKLKLGIKEDKWDYLVLKNNSCI